MSDVVRSVIDRFPDRERRIHTLFETSQNFEALCRKHDEVTQALHRLEAGVAAGTAAETDTLRKRRAALDDQLLAMMQQAARV